MYVRNIIIRFCDGAPSTAFTYLFTHTIPLLVYTLGYTVLLYTHSYSKHAILQCTHTWTTLPNKVYTCTIEVGMVPFPPLSQLCSPERGGESVWERERGWSMYVCMYVYSKHCCLCGCVSYHWMPQLQLQLIIWNGMFCRSVFRLLSCDVSLDSDFTEFYF